MATQPVRTDGEIRRRSSVPAGIATSRLLRYQLNVLAVDAADAARFAGGWLFDRAMAGWEVNVLLADGRDVRPLQILGARTAGLDAELPGILSAPEHAAVSAQALADERVHAGVLRLLRSGMTEVALWGDRWPGGFGSADAVGYRLSAAAKIFKEHAVAAAGMPGPVGATETLLRGGYRPIDSDLMPVG